MTPGLVQGNLLNGKGLYRVVDTESGDVFLLFREWYAHNKYAAGMNEICA